MRSYILILTGFCFLSCSDERVVQKSDIAPLLDDKHVLAAKINARQELDFWSKKLESDEGNFVYQSEMAAAHLSLFKLSGVLDHLQQGEKLFTEASGKLADKDPELLQSLAQLSITTHSFRQASNYNEKAKMVNASPASYHFLAFDAAMELGEYNKAELMLQGFSDVKSFHYLIRRSKLQDQQGDLNGAISTMEMALEVVTPRNKPGLLSWTLSNLADMYGHAGRIRESYDTYRKVLAKDPGYLYALKGVAWIAYAHDNDPVFAEQIIRFIMKHDKSPEHHLQLSEILKWRGEHEGSGIEEASFMRGTNNVTYRGMYNKYLIQIFSSQKEHQAKAISVAEEEVKQRSTPETYSWLAWAYFKAGNKKEAEAIYMNHVAGRTFEPECLLTGAYIFRNKAVGKELFKECIASSFELGPVAIAELKEYYQAD